MSLPGGIADKLGGQYESRWTLRCALRVLAGLADWIEIEPLGPSGEGIEFVFSENQTCEHHQVKRGRTGIGHWTLKALNSAGVLRHFRRILDQQGSPRFVSAHDAHELHELSDRARASATLEEFTKRLGVTWGRRFGELGAWWEWDAQATYEALRRTDVAAVGDDELDEWNLSIIERHVDGHPARALASLAELLIDHMQERLDERALREHLRHRYGLAPRRWADTTVGVRVREATVDYRSPLEAIRLRRPIRRLEADHTIELLRAGERLGVLISGAAGAGKSDVLVQAIDALASEGWEVLAMRVDRLTETPRPDGIGEQLQLPGSPVAVLGAVAGDRPSLLVIDQLDAVSLASGRLRGLWEPTWAMVEQAKAHPGMRVLAACRTFDLANDPRLRELTADDGPFHTVEVQPLAPEQINDALAAMGLQPGRLSEAQRQLVELPLHLKLLEPLARAAEELDFTTVTELFDAFWEQTRMTVEHRDGDVRFGSTLRLLSDTMSDRRTLSVPRALLELKDLDRSARVLASERVLISDGASYAFFHEHFFDYTFARYHLAAGRRVLDLLIGDEQDLFRRAQVRQVLLQERDRDHAAYVSDLHDLLDRDDVRFHIRQLVLALQRDLRDPTAAEFEVIRAAIEGDPADPRAPLAWRAVSAPTWFDLLDGMGALASWLASERDDLVDGAVRVLCEAGVARDAARVAALIRDACDWSERWRARVAFVVRLSDLHADRAIFDLALDLARRAPVGTIDRELWLDVHDLPANAPSWAGEALALLLERALGEAEALGLAHPLDHSSWLENEYTAQKFVLDLAENGPLDLAQTAVPWMLAVAERDVSAAGPASSIEDSWTVDHVWGYRSPGDVHAFSDALLTAVEGALARASACDPQPLASLVRELSASSLDVAQLLLYRTLASNPGHYAEVAAQLLLEDERRFRCGYTEDQYWVTRELLSAIGPKLSAASFSRLEERIMGWTPVWERRADARSYRGSAQLRLLGGLDSGRLSDAGRRRLQELGRKLGGETPEPPQGVRVGQVISPISAAEAHHMSDDQWLAAINKHRTPWLQKHETGFVGGPEELASVFEVLARQQPERFARLGLLIPRDAPASYAQRLLLSLAQRDADAEPASDDAVFALVRHLADRSDMRNAQWIAYLVGSRADHDVPDDILGIVATIAGHVDGDMDAVTQDEDPWTRGRSTVRGAAAEAIARLLHARPERTEHLIAAVRALSLDPSAAVRTCAAEALGALMQNNRGLAFELLLLLVDTDDRAVAAPPVVDLLAAFIPTDWSTVCPIVERLLTSEHVETHRGGATLATLGALQQPEASDMLERCLGHAEETVRQATARVLAANLHGATYTEVCARSLRRLFEDDSADVRGAAVRWLWQLDHHELGEFGELTRSLLRSRALEEGRSQLMHTLKETTAQVSELIVELAEQMIGRVQGLGDISTSAGGDARELSELLVQVLGVLDLEAALRARALDALDRLVAAGAWGVVDAMESVER